MVILQDEIAIGTSNSSLDFFRNATSVVGSWCSVHYERPRDGKLRVEGKGRRAGWMDDAPVSGKEGSGGDFKARCKVLATQSSGEFLVRSTWVRILVPQVLKIG